MAVSITEALDIIYDNVTPLSTEILPIEMALGCIMAEDAVATFNLPRFDNSAMDGYAVKCEDENSTVVCNEVIYAGCKPEIDLQRKSAIKIMTGAPIPKGCEAIVPIENVTALDNKVTLPSSIELNAHIRRSGEDIKSGTVYLQKGEKVTAYSIALLVSQGVTHLTVYRKIKIAVFGTGDELRPHFEKIEPHQLYNSNTPMFLTRASELGCDVRYIPSSGDTIDSLENSIKSALDADIIITSGGVSVGDKDFTKEAFKNLGMKPYFEKVDIKPGKPTAFGKIDNTHIVNLPGNPLASMVNYEIFIRAIIRKMSGAKAYYHGTILTQIREDIKLKKGKYAVSLGQFDGKTFMPLKQQLPGMVSPMQKADAMMITTPDVERLKKGSKIKILPIVWELTSLSKEALFSS
ncbi:MAG: gephyrin-like molybdotransferase Glp [Campylobacterota bacterium]|nr:gephyrin-like molybdotransferase Glp [Campylobacterota bacterium]